MIKYSVIVPIYNVEKYLNQCLDSIIYQTENSKEIILVVDETCSDNSGVIANGYGEKYDNVQVVTRAHNGLGDARNYGMKFAKGEYIIFVDSDDFFDNTSYLKRVNEVIEDSHPDYIIGHYKKCNEDGKDSFKVGREWDESILKNADLSNKIEHIIYADNFSISAWAKVYRREFLEKEGLQFEKIFSEDIPWTSKILNSTKKIEIINDNSYNYRLRGDSLSGVKSVKHYIEFGKALIKWNTMLSKNAIAYEAQYNYLAYQYYIYIASIYFFEKKDRVELWKLADQLQHCTKYSNSKKTKACKILCSLFGKKTGAMIMNQYIQRR